MDYAPSRPKPTGKAAAIKATMARARPKPKGKAAAIKAVMEPTPPEPKGKEAAIKATMVKEMWEGAAGAKVKVEQAVGAYEVALDPIMEKWGKYDVISGKDTGLWSPGTSVEKRKLAADIKAAGLGGLYQDYLKAYKGLEHTISLIPQISGEGIDVAAALKVGVSPSAVAALAGEAPVAEVVAAGKYRDWTAHELMYGKVRDGVLTPSPWGVKEGVYYPPPVWAKEKIDVARIEALVDLGEYKVETETGRTIVRATPEFPRGKREPEVEVTYSVVDMLAEKIPESKILLAGFTEEHIVGAKLVLTQQQELEALEAKYRRLEYRLKSYTETQQVPTLEGEFLTTIDIGKALSEEVVTEEELEDLGFSQKDIDKTKVYHNLGWKVYIPIYGTIATWSVMSPTERALSVAADALLVVPTIGWLGKAGSASLRAQRLAVGIAPKIGRLARVGAAAKSGLFAAEQLLVAPVKFPIQVLRAPKPALKGLWEITKFPFVHPLETIKGVGAITAGRAFLGEPATLRAIKFLTTRAIPEAAIVIPTRGTGVQRLFITRGLTESEALEATRMMQIRLSSMVASGERIPKTIKIPVYEGGKLKFTVEFPTTQAMRELGIATHSSPFAERILAGAAEPTPRKVYFSNAMSPEWTGVTARGYTTPEAVELGRGGAVIKGMRINRLFDPVSRVYRYSVELEMTTAAGTQLVTGRKPVLEVLRAQGNVKVYPSVVMTQTAPKDIVAATRASSGKLFKFKPINFDEIMSTPKGIGGKIKQYVRVNKMMVGGSTAERTWTDTTKLPEDLDLISMRNTAKLDARNLVRIYETSGSKFRIKSPAQVGREVWRIEVYDSKTGKWTQVADVIDYRVHKTYNPDVLNREPVTIEGIKVEHPLEQVERIVAKYGEYQRGEITLAQHRGHPKRLAWMAEALLDIPGGRLTPQQTKTLEVIATRLNYAEIPLSKIIRMKFGGLRDAIRDAVVPRRIKIRLPDGSEAKVPKNVVDELKSFLKNRPGATKDEIRRVVARLINREVGESVAKLAREGKFRDVVERVVREGVIDPVTGRRASRGELRRIIDYIEAEQVYNLMRTGRLTPYEVSTMFYSGVMTSGTARALVELVRGDRIAPREIAVPVEVRPVEVRPERARELRRELREELGRLPREVTELEREPYRLPEEVVELEREPYRLEEEPYRPKEPYRPLGEVVRLVGEPYRPPGEPYEPPPRPPRPPVPPPPPKVPPVILPGAEEKAVEVRIPPGSITWKQGRLKQGDVWKYIPPPWDQLKPITLVGKVPAGAKNVEMRTPKETIQLIGEPEAEVPESVSIDLGIADIYITNYGRNIQFSGGGLKTVVGERIDVPEKGMSIPAKETPLGIIGLKVGTTFVELLKHYNHLKSKTVSKSELETIGSRIEAKSRVKKSKEALADFVEERLSEVLPKMSYEEIASGLRELEPENEEATSMILSHLPDRARANVERLLAEVKEFVRVGEGYQYAEVVPDWRKVKELEAEALGEAELGIEEERAKKKLKKGRIVSESAIPEVLEVFK